jgi:hypothetical protein
VKQFKDLKVGDVFQVTYLSVNFVKVGGNKGVNCIHLDTFQADYFADIIPCVKVGSLAVKYD